MKWTRSMAQGAIGTALGTVVFTALSLLYLWVFHAEGVGGWQFTKMAAVISAVWVAIGITMGIFIVMIIKKNEGRS